MAIQTVHIAVRKEELGEMSPADFANADALVVTRRPAATAQAGTGNDELSKYYDGLGYQDSANYPAGVMTGFYVSMAHPDWRKNQQLELFISGAAPAPGRKYTNISLYKENAADDGIAVQVEAGVAQTYYKFQIDYDDAQA